MLKLAKNIYFMKELISFPKILFSETRILQLTNKQSKFNPAFFHNCSLSCSSKAEDKLIVFTQFKNEKNKNKNTFLEMIKIYKKNFPTRKNHLEFIRSALTYMREYDVHTDLEAYKKLFDAFPKGVFVAQNQFQISMMYHPQQQSLALDILNDMGYYGVSPDAELINIIIEVFGKKSNPWTKVTTMAYWGRKFKNKTPWPLPIPLPSDPFILGKMAVERITSVDIKTQISTFMTEELPESIDKTWIVSGQSPQQIQLLRKHAPNQPVIVEGGDTICLRHQFIQYFILKGDSKPYECLPPPDKNDLLNMKPKYFNLDYVEKEPRSVHCQDDGIIYAVCVTGTSSKDSLLSWVRFLQRNENPILETLPVLFRLRAPDISPVPQSTELTQEEIRDQK